MFLDKWDSLDLSINQIYNKFETEIVKNQIKESDIVIDIGAHIGYFSLIFAKLVGNNGKVFSFEPEPENYKILKKNIEINNYQNVILEQKGVSDINNSVKLYSGSTSSGSSRIYKPEQNLSKFNKNTIDIQTIILDEYFSKLGLTNKINFIKMDIEGAEILALKGMQKILRESENLKIFTEFNREFLEDAGTNPNELFELLENEGFSIYYVDNIKNKIIPVDKNLLFNTKIHKIKTINLLCIK